MKASEVKKRLLKNPEVKKVFEENYLAREISKMLIKARIERDITQEQLADKVGTKQPSIARMERGEYLPSLTFLQKIAKALDTRLVPPQFEFLAKEAKIEYNSPNQTRVKNIILISSFPKVATQSQNAKYEYKIS